MNFVVSDSFDSLCNLRIDAEQHYTACVIELLRCPFDDVLNCHCSIIDGYIELCKANNIQLRIRNRIV